jgi:hypothetical protein
MAVRAESCHARWRARRWRVIRTTARVVTKLACESAEGQRTCVVGSFDTGERSTVFVMRKRQVRSITISLSTP